MAKRQNDLEPRITLKQIALFWDQASFSSWRNITKSWNWEQCYYWWTEKVIVFVWTQFAIFLTLFLKLWDYIIVIVLVRNYEFLRLMLILWRDWKKGAMWDAQTLFSTRKSSSLCRKVGVPVMIFCKTDVSKRSCLQEKFPYQSPSSGWCKKQSVGDALDKFFVILLLLNICVNNFWIFVRCSEL